MKDSKMFYSRREAAIALSLGVRTIDVLIKTGQLAATRVGRRVLVPVEALQAFGRKTLPVVAIDSSASDEPDSQ
jgi:excisionase family DNA binding protein